MLRRLMCLIGMHGPNWGGHGLSNASLSNGIVGPGHRRCTYCSAEWGADEGVWRGRYPTLEWTRIYPPTDCPQP